jgi:hypothetical protein
MADPRMQATEMEETVAFLREKSTHILDGMYDVRDHIFYDKPSLRHDFGILLVMK